MTKASIEERILALEEENRRLRELIADGRRDLFDITPDRIFPAKTSAGTGTYPVAPANVFPIIFQDIVVDTATTGDQTVTRRNRSAEPKRNCFSASFLGADADIFVVEHLGHYHAIQAGGAGSNLIAGLAKGIIGPQSTGEIDNLEVILGSYGTIASSLQTEDVFNDTTAFQIQDNAWVLAVQRNDGTWYVVNAECLGDTAYGLPQPKESITVDGFGDMYVSKTHELVVGVTSENGNSLIESVHYNVSKANKRISLVESTYPGSGPTLYRGGHVVGELMEVVYFSKD